MCAKTESIVVYFSTMPYVVSVHWWGWQRWWTQDSQKSQSQLINRLVQRKASCTDTFPIETRYLWVHLQNECNVSVLALFTVWKTYLTFGKNVGSKYTDFLFPNPFNFFPWLNNIVKKCKCYKCFGWHCISTKILRPYIHTN